MECHQPRHCHRYQEGSVRYRNGNRCFYFPKPTYGTSRLQPDPPRGPNLQLIVAENVQQFLPPMSFAMQPVSHWFELSSSAKWFGADLPSWCSLHAHWDQGTKEQVASYVCSMLCVLRTYFSLFPGVFLLVWGWFFVWGFWLFGFGVGWFVIFIVDVAFWGRMKIFLSISFPCRLQLGG